MRTSSLLIAATIMLCPTVSLAQGASPGAHDMQASSTATPVIRGKAVMVFFPHWPPARGLALPAPALMGQMLVSRSAKS